MKITYIANSRMPTEKAHGIQIMNMCAAFAAHGHDVTLVVPRRRNNIIDDSFNYYGMEKKFALITLPTIDLVGLGRIGFLVESVSFSVCSLFFGLKNKAEIIYSRDELPLWFLSFFRKGLVWEVHTNRFNSIIKQVAKASRVIAISAGLREYFISRGVCAENIMVAPDGVDLGEFEKAPNDKTVLRRELGLPERDRIVGYVGKYTTMGKTKGVDALFEAFSEVVKKVPNALLVLVGINENERGRVSAVVAKTDIPAGRFIIISHVRHVAAVRYMKAADVLVMNYPNIEHYAKYMSPLKLFEYMASGSPIVATDLPSVREIINESSAVIIPPDDSEALGQAIVDILGNSSYRERIALEAFRSVKNYSWETRAKNIIKAIQ